VATVSLHGVGKSFGTAEIIRDVSLEIPDGAFVALVGPSGSGKSTLLRMIAGLEDVTRGTVAIGGRVVNDLPPKARDIAMVFQNYALYPHMTVAENLGFALRMRGVSRAEVAARVGEVAAALDLEALLGRYPRQLSGGQRQRVATGRAIVRNPRLFLFDEPLSNLDAKLRVQVRGELRALHRRLGITSVYVTHDQVEAMTMADLIVVLRDGRVEQVGAPLDLYDRPANTFVATFIGSPAMTLLNGRYAGGVVTLADGTRLPAPDAPPLAEGTQVTVGVRPEHWTVAPAGVAVRLTALEPTGAETVILGELSGTEVLAVTRERLALGPGASVALQPSHLHWFDTEGRRIPRS
jgi:multiple sugar transport system ATP-binding protein